MRRALWRHRWKISLAATGRRPPALPPDGLVRFAMAALLEYLHDTQIKGVERLKTVINYNKAQFMRLSPVTRANLELTETLRGREKRGTLLWVLDKTSTSMGKRMLRSWIEQPLVSSALINHRLNAVESLVKQTMARGDLDGRAALHCGYGTPDDPRRSMAPPHPRRSIRWPRPATVCPACAGRLKPAAARSLLNWQYRSTRWRTCRTRIHAGGGPGSALYPQGWRCHPPEATMPRWTSCGLSATTPRAFWRSWKPRLQQETGIPKLKIGYNHVFGYYIEVSNSYKSMVPETYIRKQTLTSGERYITQELKELESKILGAHERLITLEHRLFSELLESISAQLDRIQRTANAVAQLDVLTALAQVAAENNYCRPIVDDSDELTITEGRHPVVEQMLKGSLFVPNDTTPELRSQTAA